MGILNSVASGGLSAVGLGGLTRRKTDPKGFDPDFKSGLQIVEIIKDKEQTADAIQLVGSFLPYIPFEFGGKQQIVKDYYPGNSEPVMQILGPREDDVTVHGKFKTKRFKLSGPQAIDNANKAGVEYQQLVDAMRLRGNLVKITLGEWRRYGFIESCSFKLNRLTDIEYSITFAIVGFNLPKNCKNIDGADDDLIAPNKVITANAAKALAAAKNYPDSMPRTIAELLNDITSSVASVVTGVTNFVEGAMADIENITASATRAVGLIKNVRTSISKMNRRIGQLEYNIASLSQGAKNSSLRNAFQLNNAAHLKSIVRNYSDLALLFAALQKRFEALSKTVPLRRVLVKSGDTLQGLAIQFYNDANLWKNIYDHNQLTSSVLVVGSVLEIPKV